MNASGIWRGYANGQIGHFKFVNVEVLPEQRIMKTNNNSKIINRNNLINNVNNKNSRICPSTVDELLLRIGLKDYTSVFVMNG